MDVTLLKTLAAMSFFSPSSIAARPVAVHPGDDTTASARYSLATGAASFLLYASIHSVAAFRMSAWVSTVWEYATGAVVRATASAIANNAFIAFPPWFVLVALLGPAFWSIRLDQPMQVSK